VGHAYSAFRLHRQKLCKFAHCALFARTFGCRMASGNGIKISPGFCAFPLPLGPQSATSRTTHCCIYSGSYIYANTALIAYAFNSIYSQPLRPGWPAYGHNCIALLISAQVSSDQVKTLLSLADQHKRHGFNGLELITRIRRPFHIYLHTRLRRRTRKVPARRDYPLSQPSSPDLRVCLLN